jgi:hypothetical protein
MILLCGVRLVVGGMCIRTALRNGRHSVLLTRGALLAHSVERLGRTKVPSRLGNLVRVRTSGGLILTTSVQFARKTIDLMTVLYGVRMVVGGPCIAIAFKSGRRTLKIARLAPLVHSVGGCGHLIVDVVGRLLENKSCHSSIL